MKFWFTISILISIFLFSCKKEEEINTILFIKMNQVIEENQNLRIINDSIQNDLNDCQIQAKLMAEVLEN